MCPEQQNKGSCKLTRCPYPHQSCTIKIEQSHIEQPERVRRTKQRTPKPKCPSKDDIIESTAPAAAASHKMLSNKHQVVDDPKLNAKRYFDDGDDDRKNAQKIERNSKKLCDQMNSSDSTSECSNATENVEQIIVVRKPIVGSLPSFIPIG